MNGRQKFFVDVPALAPLLVASVLVPHHRQLKVDIGQGRQLAKLPDEVPRLDIGLLAEPEVVQNDWDGVGSLTYNSGGLFKLLRIDLKVKGQPIVSQSIEALLPLLVGQVLPTLP